MSSIATAVTSWPGHTGGITLRLKNSSILLGDQAISAKGSFGSARNAWFGCAVWQLAVTKESIFIAPYYFTNTQPPLAANGPGVSQGQPDRSRRVAFRTRAMPFVQAQHSGTGESGLRLHAQASGPGTQRGSG